MKIIHGSYAEDQTATTTSAPAPTDYKSCPICGAVCFADMEVCFGCLHQFDAKDEQRALHPEGKPEQGTNPSSEPHSAAKPEEPQESYSEEEIAALLEQMRGNFALPAQETVPAQPHEPVKIPVDEAPLTQTAGSGQDGNGVTARHVCEGKDGQQFEITISIKML